jgi:hypothetical protein
MRRQAELGAHMIAQPSLDLGMRSIVLPAERIEGRELGQVIGIRRPGPRERAEKARGALVIGNVVCLRQGGERKLTPPAGEFHENLFEIAIDNTDLPPRRYAVAIVEHRVPGRKVEQTGSKLVEKPPVMLGFAVRLRHDRTPTQPYSERFRRNVFFTIGRRLQEGRARRTLQSPDDFAATSRTIWRARLGD